MDLLVPWICPPRLLQQAATLTLAVEMVQPTPSLLPPLKAFSATCPSSSTHPLAIPSISCGVQTTTPLPSPLSLSFATRHPTRRSHLANITRASCVRIRVVVCVLHSLSYPLLVSQVVNDTNPTFYYCGTPTHCEKGMFGIINPPNAYQQPGSLSAMMSTLVSQNPSTNASWAYASNYTANNSVAANWGMNLDMSKMPTWAASYAAENMMYSQMFFAANPGTLSPSGAVNLANLSNDTTVYPMDVAAAARQNNAGYGTPSSSSPASSGASPSATSSPSGALKNGAGALASPRIVVALVAVAAAAFTL
jgi:hypothetical protein